MPEADDLQAMGRCGDTLDRAQQLDALAVQSAITLARRAATAPRLRSSGFCLNPVCDTPLAIAGGLFCNPKCGAEHARRVK